MLVREMVSYAPMPSTERTVCWWLAWVARVMALTTVSVPALLERANWWGAHAAWMAVA